MGFLGLEEDCKAPCAHRCGDGCGYEDPEYDDDKAYITEEGKCSHFNNISMYTARSKIPWLIRKFQCPTCMHNKDAKYEILICFAQGGCMFPCVWISGLFLTTCSSWEKPFKRNTVGARKHDPNAGSEDDIY